MTRRKAAAGTPQVRQRIARVFRSILIAQERGAALVAARVVHGIAQNVTLTWAQTPASALQWLQGNRDTAAVIVEVQAQSCASFVEELRGLGLRTPVVVVAGSARLEP